MTPDEIREALLAKRGIGPDEREEFLNPDGKHLLKSNEVPGIEAAADVIMAGLRAGRKIVVFGDYDCDGVCAAAIIVKTLRKLGGAVEVFLPNRFTEGYGMTPASVERMLSENPEVGMVVSVDSGITCAGEVAKLRERGIAVVVTDHHLVPDEVPECEALVDMKLSDIAERATALGCGELCGAGVAFFLAYELTRRATAVGMYDGPSFSGPLTVLAGLATVADVVPLRRQNRILVKLAVGCFRNHAPKGLKELMSRAAKRATNPRAEDFGFVLGPRVNAAGRVASAKEAYDLLMTEDAEEARILAMNVDRRNVERKELEERMTAAARMQIPDPIPEAVTVNDATDDPQKRNAGVSGIVAAKLMTQIGRPVAVVVDGRGSARAPDGYNLHSALSECAEFLDRFGGHAAAGGFSVKEGMLEEFRAAFAAACGRQAAAEDFAGEGEVEPDIWLKPDEVNAELIRVVEEFGPFGEGNPEPRFGLRGVRIAEAKVIGKDGKHAAFAFADGRIPRATWWNNAGKVEELRAAGDGMHDIVFTVEMSDFGELHPELRLVAIGESR